MLGSVSAVPQHVVKMLRFGASKTQHVVKMLRIGASKTQHVVNMLRLGASGARNILQHVSHVADSRCNILEHVLAGVACAITCCKMLSRSARQPSLPPPAASSPRGLAGGAGGRADWRHGLTCCKMFGPPLRQRLLAGGGSDSFACQTLRWRLHVSDRGAFRQPDAPGIVAPAVLEAGRSTGGPTDPARRALRPTAETFTISWKSARQPCGEKQNTRLGEITKKHR